MKKTITVIRVALALVLLAISWVPLIVSIVIGRVASLVGGDPFKVAQDADGS